MRIVQGYGQGRALLERRPGSSADVPPGVEQQNARVFGEPLTAGEGVRRILDDVRQRGDAAVREYASRIDGQTLAGLEAPKEQWKGALAKLPAGLSAALRTAAGRIRAFHEAAMPKAWQDPAQGYGEAVVPLDRVGLYVPYGLVSSALMTAIPAKVAGVRELVVCTPRPGPEMLAAAELAGVDRVFQIGGAQAVGAMAFGTQSVPKVDKICGPGSIFVALAKREVYGVVDIDGLYGPTETVVVADDSASPVLCAADLLAQAEHDEMASPVLLTTSLPLAERVAAEVERQLQRLERRTIAGAAMERQGVAVVVETIEQAIAIANAFAPEHLCLLVREPSRYVSQVTHAGGIFLGESSPEVIGDYVAGPSHAMPTGGTARFASYLGVHHFLRHVPVVALSDEQMRELGPAAVELGAAEGLTAHVRAMQLRLEGEHG